MHQLQDAQLVRNSGEIIDTKAIWNFTKDSSGWLTLHPCVELPAIKASSMLSEMCLLKMADGRKATVFIPEMQGLGKEKILVSMTCSELIQANPD